MSKGHAVIIHIIHTIHLQYEDSTPSSFPERFFKLLMSEGYLAFIRYQKRLGSTRMGQQIICGKLTFKTTHRTFYSQVFDKITTENWVFLREQTINSWSRKGPSDLMTVKHWQSSSMDCFYNEIGNCYRIPFLFCGQAF